jgi:hypothetical protein
MWGIYICIYICVYIYMYIYMILLFNFDLIVSIGLLVGIQIYGHRTICRYKPVSNGRRYIWVCRYIFPTIEQFVAIDLSVGITL